MTEVRDALHDRLDLDLGIWPSYGLIETEPTDEEIAAVMDAYEADGPSLAEQYDDLGESFVAAELALLFFERRGVLVNHDSKWFDAERAAEDLAEWEQLDEEAHRQLLEMTADASQDAPENYDELLGRYVGLTDGLLDDLAWEVAGDHSDDEVAVRCERVGEEFEATLDGGNEVDVEGLVGLLNRVVAETTDSNRRFTELDGWVNRVYVFFIVEAYTDPLEDYFSQAVASFQTHVQAE